MEVVLPNVAHPQGKLAIAKALEIDPHSGEAAQPGVALAVLRLGFSPPARRNLGTRSN